ncbi:MAG TPA: sugar phosphate nucleotidyltransferase [Desulfobacterales bacterium]
MKALILAAGLGTRLQPYTHHTPKPLFTIAGQTLLERAIRQLRAAGCREIAVNTHHLHDRIEEFLENRRFDIPVWMRHEPQILGTGGAIRNLADFWDRAPFLVMNADVCSDIDLRQVYRFHLSHPDPVTLVLIDAEPFNSVEIDSNQFVVDFKKPGESAHRRLLTFTGIQVLNPAVLEDIADQGFFHSIDAYRRLLARGERIRCYGAFGRYWRDIGTPQRYRQTALEQMIPEAFRLCCPERPPGNGICRELGGDGSDRNWYRLISGDRSLILADHGIRQQIGTCEADAYIDIGRHLHRCGVPVPQIYLADRFSGLVLMQDAGDEHLQDRVRRKGLTPAVLDLYRQVVRTLVRLNVKGGRGFEPAWAWQTATYSREVVLEKECRYFLDAFLKRCLSMPVPAERLEAEFARLADGALQGARLGFMHRDLQSRNILIHKDAIVLIDYQGGRIGPLQYDLASLLLDPYVELPREVQEMLFAECLQALGRLEAVEEKSFRACYRFCRLARNLQILGAFGFLSRVKGKPQFEDYIPAAVRSLHEQLDGDRQFPQLAKIAAEVYERYNP